MAAAVLSEQGVMPAYEAEEMITQSLDGIEKKSPRLGELARYVNDTRMGKSGWQPEYSQRIFDTAAKSALKNLATAEENYYEENNTYTPDLSDLAASYQEDPAIRVYILSADNRKWKAVARHVGSRKDFVYDSNNGGLQP